MTKPGAGFATRRTRPWKREDAHPSMPDARSPGAAIRALGSEVRRLATNGDPHRSDRAGDRRRERSDVVGRKPKTTRSEPRHGSGKHRDRALFRVGVNCTYFELDRSSGGLAITLQ